MSSEPPNKPKRGADLTGESEEFVLPKAPPILLPKKSRQSAPARPEDRSLPSAEEEAHKDAPDPPVRSQNRQPSSPPRQGHEHPVQRITLKEPPSAAAREHDQKIPKVKLTHDSDHGRNRFIGIILILLLVIVFLIVSVTDSESPKAPNTGAQVLPPKEIDLRANELQITNENMRRQLVEMTAQKEQLKGQLETSHDAREKAVSDLGQARSASEKELAGLRAEVARLEALVRTSEPPKEAIPAVREPLPEPRVEGKAYRVSGLLEGDTLNVRSGPGSGFSVVTQLPLGVRVIVTGAAVPNGTDLWLPCYLRGEVADPATGASEPWTARGWIHSAFLEEDG
jgi:hypothetical protein